MLAAQRAAYEQLRTRARIAVRGLRSDPGYPDLLARLRDVAQDRLGPAAVVREDTGGGIVAEDAGRRLSLTLDAAADRSRRGDRRRRGGAVAAVTGTVTRVNGPLVETDGLTGVAMHDVVELGPHRLPGEVVAVRGTGATVQAYEYTGGLAPGDPAFGSGEPLSVRLGPGLLGGIFDGLLRPLSDAPTWLVPAAVGTTPGATRWPFRPQVATGAEVAEGDALGVVEDGGPVPYLVQVPPGGAGQVEDVAVEGEYGADDRVATVSGVEVRLSTRWPVRRPRPFRARLDTVEGLHTGQRVIDLLFPLTRGGTAGVPGGFGTGKTLLLQQIAKWCDADVIVYVGCGERGNEMADVVRELAELVDPRTGDSLARRTVVIANTSNMPMMAREASIYTGVTVAEYFRDMGYHCRRHRRLHLPLGRGPARVVLPHRGAAGRGGLPGQPRVGAGRVLRARRPGDHAQRRGRLGHRRGSGLACRAVT